MSIKTLFLTLLFTVSSLWADIRMPHFVSYNVRLQRNLPVKICKRGETGELVTVTFNDQWPENCSQPHANEMSNAGQNANKQKNSILIYQRCKC